VFGFQGAPSGGKPNLATLPTSAPTARSALFNVGAYVGMVFGGDVVKSLHPAGTTGSSSTSS
jgi:hypothetical protein